MDIVQVCGPPYSGSTVVGYALNTVPGWFFGSEVLGLLPRFQQQSGKVTWCAVCGQECPYWTHELREQVTTRGGGLSAVYRVFARANPEVSCFVDGSKSLRWYRGHFTGKQIISAKHPLRMAASWVYTRKHHLGLPAEGSLDDVARLAAADPARVLHYLDAKMTAFAGTYDKDVRAAPDGRLCRTDELHLEGFAELGRLCTFLGIDASDVDLQRFSTYEVHPLGGNWGPRWLRLDRLGLPAKEHPRRTYYCGAESYGDYKVDNKYQQLLVPSVLDEVMALDSYRALCDQLGYPPDAPR